jgi:hypothetical protein
MQRRSVVLPEPLAPIIATVSPGATSRSRPLRTSRSDVEGFEPLQNRPKLGAVLDDAYADLFGVAPHIENESSTRNLLAKRIVDLARTGETDPELLKQYAMAGFALRKASAICAVISQLRPVTLARRSQA